MNTPASIQSMTGFARAEGEAGAFSWIWEAKSVNARGLDVRSRVPPGFDRFEPKIRDALKARVSRGSISVSLTAAQGRGAGRWRLNEDLLGALAAALPKIETAVPGAGKIGIDGVLAVRGLFEWDEAGGGNESAALNEALMQGLESMADTLAHGRREEGAKLAGLLGAQLDELRALTARAEASKSTRPEAVRARFAAQISEIAEGRAGLSEDRLAQEAAVLAVKADVREELDRLSAHIDAAAALLAAGGAVGRRLDFLAQELNREANTLTAKAGGLDLGAAGLEMKAVVDQIREQAQNVE
ncbi:MAG: YicC/YloC family endoribonuclease [Rhodospirillales bacterium]